MMSVETFAGGGGFLLGAKAAGFDCRLAIDIDERPLDVLEHYVNLYFEQELRTLKADFLKLTAKDILKAADLRMGRLDHFHGSWPCQDFSTVNSKGRKKVNEGEDEIYKLLNHFVDMVAELRPKIVTGENVPGAVAGDALRHLQMAAGRLKNAGYDVIVEKVRCLNYGVPQDRVRVFLLAKLKEIPGELVFPEPPPMDVDSLRIGQAFPGVARVKNTSFKDRFYEPDEYLPTVTATQSLEFFDVEWRNPTIPELLIAQTFPPEYVHSLKWNRLPYTAAHKLIGNAVPCKIAEVIMNYMKSFL